MRIFGLAVLVLGSWLALASGGIVSGVRDAIARGDFAAAEKLARDAGDTSEGAEAFSWLARGALSSGQLRGADGYAAEARRIALARLKATSLANDKSLETALGASIEVQANVLARRGDRSGAVGFLNRELKTWPETPLRTRIQKNLNLLTLTGRPAPPLDVAHWLGPKPASLAGLKGRPVLLFFWAHWCPDCKAEVAAIAKLAAQYGPKGLIVMGPTQRYGYAAGGEDATAGQETQYIDRVRHDFYAALGNMPVPLSEENFRRYGASTVPTLVLIDRAGVVRLYHPGEMPYEELARSVDGVMANAKRAGHPGR